MTGQRTIIHVDLDAFFVAVEQARNPDLAGRPVIVGGDPDGRGVAATASYEARVFGVRSGMALSTARRLCPQAVFLRGDFKAYREASQRFHEIVRAYSPLVEPGGLDEAYVDVTGCGPIVAPLTGGLESDAPEEVARAAGEDLRRRVRDELSLAASAGIAGGKSTAKIASDAAKPDGLLLVPAGGEAAFLAPRPLRDLPGLGPKAESALHRLGVRTLGQLAAMPASRLEALFGVWGPALGERAAGVDRTPVASGRERARSVSREGTYARDIDDVTVLRGSLRGYAESVGAELRRQDLRGRCITLKLRYSDFSTISRSRTLPQPTYSDDEIYRTAASLLQDALAKDGRAVRLLGLGVSHLGDDAVQLGLFGDETQPRDTLLHSIDRLREKYGQHALQKGQTFFDPYVGGPDWEHERQTGLSSQMGLEQAD